MAQFRIVTNNLFDEEVLIHQKKLSHKKIDFMDIFMYLFLFAAYGIAPMVNFINILLVRFSYKRAFLPKSFHQSQNVIRKKLRQALSYKKRVHKMLMKLTPNVRAFPRAPNKLTVIPQIPAHHWKVGEMISVVEVKKSLN